MKLIMAGGGCSAIVYLGLLKYLEGAGREAGPRHVAGASMGAFFALIWALDIPIEKDFIGVALEFFKKRKIYHYQYDFDKFGLDDGSFFEEILLKYMPRGQTFSELYAETHINLVIVAACITKQAPAYFSYENTPDVPVLDALKASVAVPLFTHAVEIDGELYVDGGLADNVPIFAWGKEAFFRDKNEYIIARTEFPYTKRALANIMEYAVSLIETLVRNYSTDHKFLDREQVINFPECPLSFLPVEFKEDGIELILTPELITKSIDYGYATALAAFNRASAVRSPEYSVS